MLLHYISITWKLIAAFIPPADWHRAYPTFILSLVELVGVIYLLKEVRDLGVAWVGGGAAGSAGLQCRCRL